MLLAAASVLVSAGAGVKSPEPPGCYAAAVSYHEYRSNAEHDLSRALSELAGDEQRAAVAGAQVWATLALAEAIREGFASLRR